MHTTIKRDASGREDYAEAVELRHEQRAVTRREALHKIGVVIAGLGLGCTPVRVLLHDYPKEFGEDGRLVDRVLRSFVTTVIPGAPIDGANLVRAFYDRFYPFEPYTSFFASDLCERSHARYGVRFDALPLERRTRVVQQGLKADATTRKLYTGAIFLAQLSFYSGFYDDGRGCPLIEFDGRFQLRPLDQLTYPNPEAFLAASVTESGNFG